MDGKKYFFTPSEDIFLKALRKVPINPRKGKLILFADKIREENKKGNYEEKCIKNKIIPYSCLGSWNGNGESKIFFKSGFSDFKKLCSGWRVSECEFGFDRGDYVNFEPFHYKDILENSVSFLVEKNYSILEGKVVVDGRCSGDGRSFNSYCELNLGFRPNEKYFSLCLEMDSSWDESNFSGDESKIEKMDVWFKDISCNAYRAENGGNLYFVEPQDKNSLN